MGPKLYELANKVVVMTGGGAVFVRTFAEDMSQQGTKLAILDFNLEAAEAVAGRVIE